MPRITIGPPGSILDWDNWGSVVTNLLNEYDGRITALEAEQGAIGTPASTLTQSSTITTNTSGANGTEVRDAALGNYTFTSVVGRQYRATMDGAKVSLGTANTLLVVRIRNGGASTPTITSTLIAETAFTAAGAGGQAQAGVPSLSGLFTPGAGTQTLSVFGQMQGTTAVGTAVIISPLTLARSLYVEDMGPV